ncbi:MAG: FAD-dependent oxidoreductase [Lachnospiraceae bacterium]|nr:FAD-dependent oxidoreductase [Lachnospiraceae bacterium]
MFDVVVIGSGPAGMSAALYLKRAGKNVLVIEKEYEGTGQVAKSICVENYLGLPSVVGEELGESFRQHVLSQQVPFLMDEVTEMRPENGWKVILASGQCIAAKAVVYAAGAVPKRLGIQGEEEFQGKGVSYCAYCDGSLFKKKDTAVIGGGDTALSDALYLSGICRKVYLIHRRREFRSTISIEKIQEKENIEIITEANVQRIMGQRKVEKILLDDGRELPVGGVFVAIGSNPETDLIKSYVKKSSDGYVIAEEDGVTEMPGLFAAGDIRKKQLRQIVTAVSDGANAAVSAIQYLNNCS